MPLSPDFCHDTDTAVLYAESVSVDLAQCHALKIRVMYKHRMNHNQTLSKRIKSRGIVEYCPAVSRDIFPMCLYGGMF